MDSIRRTVPYKSRAVTPTKKLKKQKQKFSVLYRVLIPTLLILVCVVVTFLPYFTITQVEVVGARSSVNEQVKARIEQVLHEKKWKIWSRSNVFVYSNTYAEHVIRDSYRNILSVNSNRVGLHVIQITLSERQPVFRADNGQTSEVDLVDETGFLYKSISPTDKEINLPLIELSSESLSIKQSPEIQAYIGDVNFKQTSALQGDYVLPGESFKNLKLLVKEFELRKIHTVHVIVYADNQAGLFTDDERVRSVLVTLSDSPVRQLAVYDSAKRSNEFKEFMFERKANLEYIDVRIPGKVFYKVHENIPQL